MEPPVPTAPEEDAGSSAVRSLYSLERTPMSFGAVPWPDDAYLNVLGRVDARDFPTGADPEYQDQLTAALNDLDGFGVRPVVYVRFDGALDPASLPAGPAESLEPDASVFLVDADTSSPTAFDRIPVDVSYEAGGHEIRLRPAYGRPLVPGRRYAAVVTNRVLAANGRPVLPARRFQLIRDLPALGTSLERAARNRYSPVLQTLARGGLPRSRVVALAVFHVQTVRSDLEAARALLDARTLKLSTLTLTKAGPELDAVLGMPAPKAVGFDGNGAPHDQVGFLARGSVSVPSLLSSSPTEHGAFGRGQAGQLLSRGEQEVFFSIWLPRAAMLDATMPVVVVAHDLGGDRSDAAALANALAGSGFAVIAADAPFHGLRSGAGDTHSRFTGEARGDGFGDAPGDFIGEHDEDAELGTLHPFYFRDAVRQTALETMALFKLVRGGAFSELENLALELGGVSFDAEHVGFVGVGMGADVGAMIAPFEPEVSAFVLAFGGDSGVDSWLGSPERQPLGGALLRRLGRSGDVSEAGAPNAHSSLQPDVDIFRTLTDRASPLAYASLVRRSPANTLLLMARDDEAVPNSSTEALAYALGAVAVGGEPGHEPELRAIPLGAGETLSANVPVEGGDVTRALFMVEPASHGALLFEQGVQRYEHPLADPPVELPEAVSFANPTQALATQIGFWFGSVRACPAAAKMPCVATLQAPLLR